MRANETYSEAKRQFSDRNRDVLMNIQSPHKWWSTIKSEVFGLGTCDAPLFMSRTLQSALESSQEARIVQIDFSAAFDRVNHLGILSMLCSVDIGGSFLSILTQFLSNRSQQVMVDGCRSKLVSVVSGVPQGSVLGPLLFLLNTSELFSILEYKLIGYADDYILMAVVPKVD